MLTWQLSLLKYISESMRLNSNQKVRHKWSMQFLFSQYIILLTDVFVTEAESYRFLRDVTTWLLDVWNTNLALCVCILNSRLVFGDLIHLAKDTLNRPTNNVTSNYSFIWLFFHCKTLNIKDAKHWFFFYKSLQETFNKSYLKNEDVVSIPVFFFLQDNRNLEDFRINVLTCSLASTWSRVFESSALTLACRSSMVSW